MSKIAKLFANGRSQAVRLPAAMRFEGCSQVYIRRDPETGDVILSRKPESWDRFFQARKEALAADEVPEDFLSSDERQQADQNRDPFKGWRE